MSGSILLPGNATPLERAFADVLDTRSRYTGDLAKVPGLPWDVDNIPDDWLPWFILDEGLSCLLPYLPPREALREGRLWKRELGSAAAIIRALSWVGQHGVKIQYEPDEDEHFDLFQVELTEPVASFTEAARIAELVYLSKPTTDILGRVKSGLDGDAFRLDHSLLDGPDRLDDWSGIRIPGVGPETPDGPITWSFGDHREVRTYGGSMRVIVQMTETVCIMARPFEGFVLDASRLDVECVEPADNAAQIAMTGTADIRVDEFRSLWPHRPYPGYAPARFSPTSSITMTREE